jgi:hypothetical protein
MLYGAAGVSLVKKQATYQKGEKSGLICWNLRNDMGA